MKKQMNLLKELEKLNQLIRIHNDQYHFCFVPGNDRDAYLSKIEQ